MAFGAAKNASFTIVNAVAGTLTLTPYLTSLSWEVDRKAIDTTTFGNAYSTYVGGVADVKISGEGVFDPALSAMGTLGTATTPVAYVYGPQGASGQLYSGSGLVTKWTNPAKLDEAVTFSFEVQGTGTITVL